MNDPTFGKTPGSEIDNASKYFTNCKTCKGSVLMGRVTDVNRQFRWHAYDPKPLEHAGRLFFSRHRCNVELNPTK